MKLKYKAKGETLLAIKSMRKFQAYGKRIKSSMPIRIKVYKGDNSYIAEYEALGIYAGGGTVSEALEDFNQQIVYFYKRYRVLKEAELMVKARSYKKIYEKYFNEINRGKALKKMRFVSVGLIGNGKQYHIFSNKKHWTLCNISDNHRRVTNVFSIKELIKRKDEFCKNCIRKLNEKENKKDMP